jgi:hypothetical protein
MGWFTPTVRKKEAFISKKKHHHSPSCILGTVTTPFTFMHSGKRNTTIHLNTFPEKKHNHSTSYIPGKETLPFTFMHSGKRNTGIYLYASCIPGKERPPFTFMHSGKRNTTIHLHAFREKQHHHSPSCIPGKETPAFTFMHSGVTVSDSARVRRSPDERQWEMNSTAAFAPSMNSDFWGQCCKTFFIRNLSVVVIR